jgi:hypothetical protein
MYYVNFFRYSVLKLYGKMMYLINFVKFLSEAYKTRGSSVIKENISVW